MDVPYTSEEGHIKKKTLQKLHRNSFEVTHFSDNSLAWAVSQTMNLLQFSMPCRHISLSALTIENGAWHVTRAMIQLTIVSSKKAVNGKLLSNSGALVLKATPEGLRTSSSPIL